MSWETILKRKTLSPDEHDAKHEKRFVRELNGYFSRQIESAKSYAKEKNFPLEDSYIYQKLLGLAETFEKNPRKMYQEYKEKYPDQITRFRDFIQAIQSTIRFYPVMIGGYEDKEKLQERL
jgi:hypothetical protein